MSRSRRLSADTWVLIALIAICAVLFGAQARRQEPLPPSPSPGVKTPVQRSQPAAVVSVGSARPGFGRLACIVRDAETKKPLEGVEVAASDEDLPFLLQPMIPDIYERETDASGRAEIYLFGGNMVTFSKPLYQIGRARLSSPLSEVSLSPAGRVVVALRTRSNPARVYGSCEPPEEPDAAYAMARSRDGAITLDHLPQGRYVIVVDDATSCQRWYYPGTKNRGEAIPVTVTARQTASVSLDLP